MSIAGFVLHSANAVEFSNFILLHVYKHPLGTEHTTN